MFVATVMQLLPGLLATDLKSLPEFIEHVDAKLHSVPARRFERVSGVPQNNRPDILLPLKALLFPMPFRPYHGQVIRPVA